MLKENAKFRAQKWRGHPYALNLRSAREKLELLPNV